MKQIAINLVNGISCTIRANDGVHCAYNILNCPLRFRQTAFMIIGDKMDNRTGTRQQKRQTADNRGGLRYVLGRSNHDPNGGYGTSNFHANKYFNTVTAVQMSNRQQWIAEIK